jgi:HSP20 family protein
MEDMFDRYTRAMGWPGNRGQELVTAGDWTPRVDISETDGEFVVKAEIPDVRKEDVKVNVDNGVLTIQGERRQEKEEKGKRFHRVERSYGSFVRRFTLPENTDESHIRASFKDGLLNLQIPKAPQAKPKSIEVQVD